MMTSNAKLPRAKESEIMSAVSRVLMLYENRGELKHIRNNSGATRIKSNNSNPNDRFIRFGRAGSPDFFLFMPEGRVVHLEVKAEKGKQSTSQLLWQNDVEQLGHHYAIIRSVSEVVELITKLEATNYGTKN